MKSPSVPYIQQKLHPTHTSWLPATAPGGKRATGQNLSAESDPTWKLLEAYLHTSQIPRHTLSQDQGSTASATKTKPSNRGEDDGARKDSHTVNHAASQNCHCNRSRVQECRQGIPKGCLHPCGVGEFGRENKHATRDRNTPTKQL